MSPPLLRVATILEFPKELRASAAPAVPGELRPCLAGDCEGNQVCVLVDNLPEWRCLSCGRRESE